MPLTLNQDQRSTATELTELSLDSGWLSTETPLGFRTQYQDYPSFQVSLRMQLETICTDSGLSQDDISELNLGVQKMLLFGLTLEEYTSQMLLSERYEVMWDNRVSSSSTSASWTEASESLDTLEEN